jgi:hypothetical protein|tara:strand:- start:1103 stop:1270 length:168 start_codon:yes stop_codon:yes gene_type:complete
MKHNLTDSLLLAVDKQFVSELENSYKALLHREDVDSKLQANINRHINLLKKYING